MAEQLTVYLNEARLGVIRRDGKHLRRIRFDIDEAYAGGMSDLTEGFSTFPGTSVDSSHASNFLGGYVPEGHNRERLAERKRVDSKDLFSLLQYYGLNLAGAVSIRASDEDNKRGTYRKLKHREFIRKVKQSAEQWDLGNEPDSGRSAAAGFQPKLLIAKFDGEWFQPEHRAHSTHIIKPTNPNHPLTIFNEWYSHELTRSIGLSTFDSELIRTDGTTFLAIQRFDREILSPGEVRATHQEDSAQILDLDWEDSAAKFQNISRPRNPAGPSAARIAEIFGSIGTGSDNEIWLRHLVFNVLVGNHDGHAKNVSIIHGDGDSRIADLYDAVPLLHINDIARTNGQGRIRDDMALAINGVFQHHRITASDLVEEAASWGGMPPTRPREIVNEMFAKFADALDATQLPDGASSGLDVRLRYNLEQLDSGKAIGKPKPKNLTKLS
ncbi:HipA protein [Leifsonia rubra CMS 76R]|nr:HipA protein [Leifsonia rubra CMS 76R]